MNRILLLMSLVIFAIYVPLWSASLREQDDYAYIIELYDMQDYEEALAEMDYFIHSYPNSGYLIYLDYIKANIALAQGQYLLAEKLYEPLTKLSMHSDIKADISLNYATVLYQNTKIPEALKVLKDLSKQSDHPYYLFNGSILRGKCYQALDQYLSAEHEYQKAYALDRNDAELNLQYYKLLLFLHHEEAALSLRENSQSDSLLTTNMDFEWLQYLLYNQRYEDVNDFVLQNPVQDDAQQEILSLILVQKDIRLQKYQQAQSKLDELKSQNPQARFYQAIIFKHEGFTAQADSIFIALTLNPDSQLAFFSYLEHLQILRLSDAAKAKKLLSEYINAPLPNTLRGYQYALMAVFEDLDQAHEKALKLWVKAKEYELPMDVLDMAQIGIAEAYLKMGQKGLAIENFNKYLNSFPNGLQRQKAFFQIGKIEYERLHYSEAQQYLQALLSQDPASIYVDEANFILGEIALKSSRYRDALAYYQAISQQHPSERSVQLRIAQTYYNLDDYSNAKTHLAQVNNSYKDFESTILEASLRFNDREFNSALALYREAQSMANTTATVQEAGSYQAYTLYYLKRFDEAAEGFLQLSELNPDVDSYLYQAARSAYAGGSYSRALELYDRFIDDYPESPYFVEVLAQIAQTYYNLGNIDQSFADWLNILSRFRSFKSFTGNELGVLHDAFNGLGLCLESDSNINMITELMDMADSFNSEYIQFEINYLVVKHFADLGLWDQVLKDAEELKKQFPNHKTTELDLILAQSLIQLDQQSKAQELVSHIYEETGDAQSLATLAELAKSTNNLQEAQRLYLELYEKEPTGINWLSLLDISELNAYQDYEDIWQSGQNYASDYPQALINRIKYLIQNQDYEQATQMANDILDSATNQYIRGLTELELARITYIKQDYKKSSASFKRIRVLYRDYPQIQSEAQYYYILSLIKNDALKEAQLTLWEVQDQLSDEQIIIINDLLDAQR